MLKTQETSQNPSTNTDNQPLNFLDKELKTYKTDETIDVTNEEFLETVFGSSEQDVQPILVSFVGNPQTADKRNWQGWDRKRAIETCYLHNESNNYFSLSVFYSDKEVFNRQKKNFSALHAIMLDDIGTKVDTKRLRIEPSALIETSKDNYQAIYILSEPEKNIKKADRLMKAIIAAGLCDPGAGGPASRLARLPCAINGKYTPAFVCKVRHWNPEARYGVEQLISGLELEDFWEQTKSKSSAKNKKPRPDGSEPIYFPVKNKNPVIEKLKEKGLYKTPLGNGQHDITCPWVQEHTNGADGGTCYYEPNDEYPRGGFHCFHGHCKGRDIKGLLEFLKVDPRTTCKKSTIHADPGELDKIVDVAERELAKSSRYYQRGNTISIVTTSLENKETSITPIKPPTIRVALSSVANWKKYYASVGDYLPIDPPPAYANALFDMPSYKYLPVLKGLARQPYIRLDGSLMLSPGYDNKSCMFGVFSPQDYNVPSDPTKQQAQDSLKLLEGLLNEFCFKEQTDKAAALSAILTAAIRVSLPKAPMFHTRAPQIGSGKSYLGQIITAFSTPHLVASTTFPQDEEECKKLLLAELLKSPAAINFDNMTVDLIPYPSLCATLTEEFFSARILGASKTASVNTRTLFLSSGNNVGPIQDMGRRTITINIDAKCETPAAKEYKNPNLLEDVLSQRGRYVSAALTIIRAWIVAGRPKQPCKPLVSFGEWVELCCYPLMWLGLENPMTSAFKAMNDDPEKEMLGRLMAYWDGYFVKRAVMVRDLTGEAYRNTELLEILEDIAPGDKGGINNRSLGRWIKRHEGQVVNNLRLIPDDGKRSAKAWRLETVL